MKPLLIFYGNCQCVSLTKILRLKYHYHIKCIDCYKTEWDENKFLRFIKRAHLIIMTFIHENYRNKNYLSTKFILENCGPKPKIIILPSMYFDFYYLDTFHIKTNNKNQIQDTLIEPTPYHYKHMIKCYKKKKSVEHYITNYVTNPNLYTHTELENKAQQSINKLKERENYIETHQTIHKFNCVHISDYIKDNYKDKLLFNTFNHPSNYLLQYVAESIYDILKLNKIHIDYQASPLDFVKCILYESVQKHVNFNIKQHEPSHHKIRGLYKVCQSYHDIFRKPENRKYLID